MILKKKYLKKIKVPPIPGHVSGIVWPEALGSG